MSYDASAGSLRCPFCGCEQLEQQADSKTLAAERVVPFAHQQHDAVSSMQQWLGRGFWRPGDLAKNAVVVDMTAVYVPYWVFRGWTKTNWTADTSQTPIGARGDWFPMTGEHHGSHEGLLVGASGALTPAETAEICPFDMGRAANSDDVDLDNVTVERFNVPRKYARPIARRGMEQRDAQACDAQYVPGTCRNLQVNTLVEGMSSEPVLLPVWIMAYRYRDKVFRFLVNGQTGKCSGQAPVSQMKIAAVVGAVLLVIAMALILFICSGATHSVNRDGEVVPVATQSLKGFSNSKNNSPMRERGTRNQHFPLASLAHASGCDDFETPPSSYRSYAAAGRRGSALCPSWSHRGSLRSG